MDAILRGVIEPALKEVGASLDDVTHTRLFAADIRKDWEELGAAHGEIFGDTRPTCTLVGAELLADWMKVEVEVEAVVRA
jgi:enamine deaminase RidA (YjgF/YER057c/UK114 family)